MLFVCFFFSPDQSKKNFIENERKDKRNGERVRDRSFKEGEVTQNYKREYQKKYKRE